MRDVSQECPKGERQIWTTRVDPGRVWEGPLANAGIAAIRRSLPCACINTAFIHKSTYINEQQGMRALASTNDYTHQRLLSPHCLSLVLPIPCRSARRLLSDTLSRGEGIKQKLDSARKKKIFRVLLWMRKERSQAPCKDLCI